MIDFSVYMTFTVRRHRSNCKAIQLHRCCGCFTIKAGVEHLNKKQQLIDYLNKRRDYYMAQEAVDILKLSGFDTVYPRHIMRMCNIACY